MNLQEYKTRYYAGAERMNPALENKIKSRATSLSNNPAFPSVDKDGNSYNFEELIAYKRFLDCVDKVKRYGKVNDLSSPQILMVLQQKLMSVVQEIIRIEKPNKEYLEKLGIDLVIKEMELPRNAFKFDAKIVDMGTIEPNNFQATSKEPSQQEVKSEFGSQAMEEFMSADEYFELEKDKRRFINMLVQGASKKGHYMFELVREDLNKLHPDLADMYGIMMAINDYSYWIVPESMVEQNYANPKVMAGKEEIDNSEETPKIKTQGINFPVSVHENIKGVMDVFGTHGLPDNPVQQEMIMESTDTLLNEIMDIRYGAVVWELFISSFPFEAFTQGNRDIQHFLFMRFCQLPTEEFFEVAKYILSENPKGKKIMQDIADDVVRDRKNESIEGIFGSEEYGEEDEYAGGGSLDKRYNFPEYGIATFKELIERGVFTSKFKSVENAIKYDRNKFNRMDGKQQKEYYDKLNKQKVVYNLRFTDRTFYPVSKEIYDYADVQETEGENYYTKYEYADGGNVFIPVAEKFWNELSSEERMNWLKKNRDIPTDYKKSLSVSIFKDLPSWIQEKVKKAYKENRIYRFDDGGQADELIYLNNRISNLKQLVVRLNEDEKPEMYETIKSLEQERNHLLNRGVNKSFKSGGNVKKGYDVYDNKRMLENQSNEIEHHSEELSKQVSKTKKVPAWVIAKMERATTDLSDITHYLDGENKMENGGKVGEVKYDFVPVKDKFAVVKITHKQHEDYTYPLKEYIHQFDGKLLLFDDIKSAQKYVENLDYKYPYGGVQKANVGALLLASQMLQQKQQQQQQQQQQAQPQVVYYVPQPEQVEDAGIVQNIPEMAYGGDTDKDLNDFCITQILELANDLQNISYYSTIRYDKEDLESKNWGGKLVIVFKDDILLSTIDSINEFILRSEGCQDIFDQNVNISNDRPTLLYIYLRTGNFSDSEYGRGGKVYEFSPKKINLSKTNKITTNLGEYNLALITDDFVYFVNEEESDENAQTIMYNKKGELVSDNYFATNDFYETLLENTEFEFISPSMEYNRQEILKQND